MERTRTNNFIVLLFTFILSENLIHGAYIGNKRDTYKRLDFEDYVECCPIGYKTQIKLNPSGKEVVVDHCRVKNCCMGLREVLKIGSNGLTYSMCVRDDGPTRSEFQKLALLAKFLKKYYEEDSF